MRIINKVDPAIIDGQISMILQTVLNETSNAQVIPYLLDITLIRHAEDGGNYAAGIIDLIHHVEKTTSKPHVFREIVEAILTDIRASRKGTRPFHS